MRPRPHSPTSPPAAAPPAPPPPPPRRPALPPRKRALSVSQMRPQRIRNAPAVPPPPSPPPAAPAAGGGGGGSSAETLAPAAPTSPAGQGGSDLAGETGPAAAGQLAAPAAREEPYAPPPPASANARSPARRPFPFDLNLPPPPPSPPSSPPPADAPAPTPPTPIPIAASGADPSARAASPPSAPGEPYPPPPSPASRSSSKPPLAFDLNVTPPASPSRAPPQPQHADVEPPKSPSPTPAPPLPPAAPIPPPSDAITPSTPPLPATEEKPAAPAPSEEVPIIARPAPRKPPGKVVKLLSRKILKKDVVVPKGTVTAAGNAPPPSATGAGAAASQPPEGRVPDLSSSAQSCTVDEEPAAETETSQKAIKVELTAEKKPAAETLQKTIKVELITAEKMPASAGGSSSTVAAASEASMGEIVEEEEEGALAMGEAVEEGELALALVPVVDAGKPLAKGWENRRERRERLEREVFVGGLSMETTEEDVRAALSSGTGEITGVRMIMQATRSKGFCFVQFRDGAQAKQAIKEFGTLKICGNLCRVSAARITDRKKEESYSGKKRPTSVLGPHPYSFVGDNSSPRHDFSETASYGAWSHSLAGYYAPYWYGSSRGLPGYDYEPTDPSSRDRYERHNPYSPVGDNSPPRRESRTHFLESARIDKFILNNLHRAWSTVLLDIMLRITITAAEVMIMDLQNHQAVTTMSMRYASPRKSGRTYGSRH
ncbi:hypothetical protein ACP4OV_011676 [Aristida adscensionis]